MSAYGKLKIQSFITEIARNADWCPLKGGVCLWEVSVSRGLSVTRTISGRASGWPKRTCFPCMHAPLFSFLFSPPSPPPPPPWLKGSGIQTFLIMVYITEKNKKIESIFNKFSENIYLIGVSIVSLHTISVGTKAPILRKYLFMHRGWSLTRELTVF